MNTLLYVSLFFLVFLFLSVPFRTVEAGRRIINNHHNHHNTIFQCDPPQNTENALYDTVIRSLYSLYSNICKEKKYDVCPVSDDTCGYDKCIKQMIEEKEKPRENLPPKFVAIKLALGDNVPCIAQNLLTNYLSEIPEHELETIQTIEKLMKDDEDVRNKHLRELDIKRQEEKKMLDEKKRLEEIEALNKRYEENWLTRWIVSSIGFFIIFMGIISQKDRDLICKYFKNYISNPIKKLFYTPKRYGDNTCPCCLEKTNSYAFCGHALCSYCFDSLKDIKKCPICSKTIDEVNE
jgi:thioredoxin-related protein